MSLHKGGFLPPSQPRAAAGPWTWAYPNSADFNFNYYNLLQNAQGAIGQMAGQPTVAVIGCGVAGLLAARELYRCGVRNIDLFEATDRIGGRNYSIPAPAPGGGTQQTTYEMGAMRMPFFPAPGQGGAVLDYLCTEFNIALTPFPDPASSAVAVTGIYQNEGYGPDGTYATPTMDRWYSKGNPPPPNQTYANIYTAWSNFQNLFQSKAGPLYGTAQWTAFWQSVVDNYWMMNFRELALTPVCQWSPSNPGWFGGLGLTEEQATILYVIGVGDGGWGAFYDISCLYVFRTILSNFGKNHQLVMGRYVNGVFTPGPQYNQPTHDSLGKPMASPTYLGLQSVAECLLYMPVPGPNNQVLPSLYDCAQNPDVNISLLTQMSVTSVTNTPSGMTITTSAFPQERPYDIVIATPTTWALQMSPGLGQTFFNGFNYAEIPIEFTTAIKESHQITSSKVFWPLNQQYWSNDGTGIPQVINTDSFIQDVYGIAASANDPGVLLVSYTWEDDATKLVSTDDQTLAQACLDELDRILVRTGNPKISPYVNAAAGPTVVHWELQPTYRGCAKLYREGSFDMDYTLLTWNQNLAWHFGLYLAGEAYGVEGGWTEPALRMALDAVTNILFARGSTFTVTGFDFETNYPRWPAYSPSEQTRAKWAVKAPPGAYAPGEPTKTR